MITWPADASSRIDERGRGAETTGGSDDKGVLTALCTGGRLAGAEGRNVIGLGGALASAEGRNVIGFGGALASAEGRNVIGFGGALASAEGRNVIAFDGALAGAEGRTGTLADSGISSQPASMSVSAPGMLPFLCRAPPFATPGIWFTSGRCCRGGLLPPLH